LIRPNPFFFQRFFSFSKGFGYGPSAELVDSFFFSFLFLASDALSLSFLSIFFSGSVGLDSGRQVPWMDSLPSFLVVREVRMHFVLFLILFVLKKKKSSSGAKVSRGEVWFASRSFRPGSWVGLLRLGGRVAQHPALSVSVSTRLNSIYYAPLTSVYPKKSDIAIRGLSSAGLAPGRLVTTLRRRWGEGGIGPDRSCSILPVTVRHAGWGSCPGASSGFSPFFFFRRPHSDLVGVSLGWFSANHSGDASAMVCVVASRFAPSRKGKSTVC
jgi:hypothetical protein